MPWNYRIVKYHGTESYGLHEVYYDDKGRENAFGSDPASFVACHEVEGDNPRADIIEMLERALKDARTRPIFNEPAPGTWPGQLPFTDEDDDDA